MQILQMMKQDKIEADHTTVDLVVSEIASLPNEQARPLAKKMEELGFWSKYLDDAVNNILSKKTQQSQQ